MNTTKLILTSNDSNSSLQGSSAEPNLNKCIICNSRQTKPLYRDILKCSNCGHIFCSLPLDEKKNLELYGKDYFFGDEYNDYLADRKVFEKNFGRRFKVLKRFIDPLRHRRLLEIGCAYGFFLSLVKSRFEKVLGMDISEDAIRYARDKLRLDCFSADFLRHDFGGEKFDIVCMWDTIEHLAKPHLYLEKIAEHMEKGALVAITTPDIESLNAKIRRGRWRLIHPPTHLHYFSKKRLAKFLGDYGFDIIYSRYCGFHRSIGMTLHRIFLLQRRWLKLYNFLQKTGLVKVDFYLNLYDIIYVIARKK